MKGSDRFKASFGANIADSIATDRPTGHTAQPPSVRPNPYAGLERAKGAVIIPIEKIERDPSQPREEFSEEGLRLLADSLRDRGQLQPIRVRWNEAAGLYTILCGERRWRAAQLAGLGTLSCIVHEQELSPQDQLLIQLTENALREDLRPIEQAKAYRTLMETMEVSQRALADILHVRHDHISRALSLLQLPEPVQEIVEKGVLPPSIAHEVIKAPPEMRTDLVERAIREGLTRDDVIKARRGRQTAAKQTTVTLKTPGGPRVTVEWGRGLTPVMIRTALREALDQVEAEAA